MNQLRVRRSVIAAIVIGGASVLTWMSFHSWSPFAPDRSGSRVAAKLDVAPNLPPKFEGAKQLGVSTPALPSREEKPYTLAVNAPVAAKSVVPLLETATTSGTSPKSDAAPAVSLSQQNAAGSEQMLLAHAPLRVREIADPDSTSNQRILQDMIMKAVTRNTDPSSRHSN